MKREDWQRAYEPLPEALEGRVASTLSHLEEKPVKHVTFRAVAIAALIIALTMAAAYAADRLGWVDLFGDNYGITVPKAAEQVLSATEIKTYQVGPMTFAFTQLLTDGRIALSAADVRTTNGDEVLYADDSNVYDAVRSETVREQYHLKDGVTWLEAAAQLNLPVYGVRALLEVGEPYAQGGAMEDAMWSAGGTITYFNMPMLAPEQVSGELPVTLYMSVLHFDPSTGDVLEEWRVREEALLPVSPRMAEKAYQPDGDGAFTLTIPPTYLFDKEGNEMGCTPASPLPVTLDSLHAEQYATGIYFTISFTVPEGTNADSLRDALYSLHLCDANGQQLPAGMNLSSGASTDSLPTAKLELMATLEEMPDRLMVTDGETEMMLQ